MEAERLPNPAQPAWGTLQGPKPRQNPPQAVVQGGPAPQEDPQSQPSSATGHAGVPDALPADLPGVATDDHWAQMRFDDAFFSHGGADDAQDAGPWGTDAAPQQGDGGGSASGDGSADASKPAGSEPENGEAGLCYRSYKLGGYSIVARAPLPLKVPIQRSLKVRICHLLSSWCLA